MPVLLTRTGWKSVRRASITGRWSAKDAGQSWVINKGTAAERT